MQVKHLSTLHKRLFDGLTHQGQKFIQESQAEEAVNVVKAGRDTLEVSGSHEVLEKTEKTTAFYGGGTKVIQSKERLVP